MAQVAGPLSFSPQNASMPGLTGFDIDAAKSNTVNFNVMARGIYVGVAGNVSIVHPDGTSLIYQNMIAGLIYPLAAIRVNVTGTTATGLIGIA